MARSLLEGVLNGQLVDAVIEKGRKEIRGIVFEALADHVVRPRVDYLLGLIRKR